MPRRYCLLNDSDTGVRPEAAFTLYAREMKNTDELPVLCRGKRALVERLLLDLQATSSFNSIWDLDWQANQKYVSQLTTIILVAL